MNRNTENQAKLGWFCREEGFGDKNFDIYAHHVNLPAGKKLYKGAMKFLKTYLKSNNMPAFPRLSGDIWDIDSRKDFYKLNELDDNGVLEWIDEVILNYPAFCHVTYYASTALKTRKLSIKYKDYLTNGIVSGSRQFKVAIRFDYSQGGKRPNCIMNIFELVFKDDGFVDPLEEGREDLHVPYEGDAYAMLLSHYANRNKREHIC